MYHRRLCPVVRLLALCDGYDVVGGVDEGIRTKRENASLNSDTCSSVNESACHRQYVSRVLVISPLVGVRECLYLFRCEQVGYCRSIVGWATSYHVCAVDIRSGSGMSRWKECEWVDQSWV